MLEKIKETARFLSERISDMPKTAIILGSGLGVLAALVAVVWLAAVEVTVLVAVEVFVSVAVALAAAVVLVSVAVLSSTGTDTSGPRGF